MRGSALRLAALLGVGVLTVLSGCSGGGGPGPGDGAGDRPANEASDVGVTEDTLTLGGHFPAADDEAAGATGVPLGIRAYFEHVNDQGGVNGRTIEYVTEDDGAGTAGPVDAVRELVDRDEVFAVVGGSGTPAQRAVQDFLTGAGVPDLFVSSGSLLRGSDPAEHPYTFGWQPDHVTEGQVIGRYLAEELPGARIGLLLQDDDLGRDGEDGLRAVLPGERFVEVQRFPPGAADLAPQIAALAASGADVVVAMTEPQQTALAQLRAAGLGFGPQWIHSYAGSDPALVGPLLAELSGGAVPTAGALEGALATRYLPTVTDPADGWIELFARIWADHGDDGELTDDAVQGMAIAYTAVQGLQAAGQNPTREGLVEALEQVGGSFEGPLLAPFRWSQDSHLGAGGLAIDRIVGGAREEVRPVALADPGVVPWTGRRTGPPESGIPDEEFFE